MSESGSKLLVCEECRRLLEAFTQAVNEVVALHEEHIRAVTADELEPHRFDILIHAATDRKQNAKYAYLFHRENCSIQK